MHPSLHSSIHPSVVYSQSDSRRYATLVFTSEAECHRPFWFSQLCFFHCELSRLFGFRLQAFQWEGRLVCLAGCVSDSLPCLFSRCPVRVNESPVCFLFSNIRREVGLTFNQTQHGFCLFCLLACQPLDTSPVGAVSRREACSVWTLSLSVRFLLRQSRVGLYSSALYPVGRLSHLSTLRRQRQYKQVQQLSRGIAWVHSGASSEPVCLCVCVCVCVLKWVSVCVRLLPPALPVEVLQCTSRALLKYMSFWCNQATTPSRTNEMGRAKVGSQS